MSLLLVLIAGWVVKAIIIIIIIILTGFGFTTTDTVNSFDDIVSV